MGRSPVVAARQPMQHYASRQKNLTGCEERRHAPSRAEMLSPPRPARRLRLEASSAPTDGLQPCSWVQVSTGVTLRENNLKEIEGGHILDSQGILVGSRRALRERPGLLEVRAEGREIGVCELLSPCTTSCLPAADARSA